MDNQHKCKFCDKEMRLSIVKDAGKMFGYEGADVYLWFCDCEKSEAIRKKWRK